eukprot:UN2307
MSLYREGRREQCPGQGQLVQLRWWFVRTRLPGRASFRCILPWWVTVAAHHALRARLGAHALAARALAPAQSAPEGLTRFLVQEVRHLMDRVDYRVELAAALHLPRDVPARHHFLEGYRSSSHRSVGQGLAHVLLLEGREAEVGVLVASVFE